MRMTQRKKEIMELFKSGNLEWVTGEITYEAFLSFGIESSCCDITTTATVVISP